MSFDEKDDDLAPLRERLQPYARAILDRAAAHALRLHADAVTPEHLLSALMQDPDCAAHAAVLHAFADPETICDEALAISPGLMVVASGSTLPFSPRAAQALSRARRAAEAAGRTEVCPADLIEHALAYLDPPVLERLRAAGLNLRPIPLSIDAVAIEAALFKHFSSAAKRALSAANRFAAGHRLPAISPAHLVVGCIKEDDGLARSAGLDLQRARALLGPEAADATPPKPRHLPLDAALVRFLRGLPADADSLELLSRFFSADTPELAHVLTRSRLTDTFLARARRAFQDPPGEASARPGDPRTPRRPEGMEL